MILSGVGSAQTLSTAGLGSDTVNYSNSSVKVVVRLWNQTASGAGSTAEGDMIAGFEHVLGGAAGDAIVGSDNVSNFIAGNGGNDAIQGLSGYDTLRGGAARTI